jgi:hypothetical protein
MAGFSLDIIGLEAAIARTQNLSLRAEAGARQAVTGATNDALDASLPLIPVRTGFLYSRQHVNFGGSAAGALIWNELANDARYAEWVCFGHHTRSGSWVPAQDFMTGPREVGRRSLESRMGNILVGGD